MTASNEVFWGEISPCEHLVQIYENPEVFLDSLEGFAAGGLSSGDGVVVIAMPAHLSALHERLSARGFDLDQARSCDQYIDLEAEETLAKFMRNGWPDESLFMCLVSDLLARAGTGGRRVRAFGEMVAVLWENGHNGATVRLEHLWHGLCQKEAFSLFCAYPRIGFTQDADASIREICAAHSRVVTGSSRRGPETFN
jgi:hypothetical protein